MTDSVEDITQSAGVAANTNPAPASSTAPSIWKSFYNDLQADYYTLGNNALWNFAMLYGVYVTDLDKMIFKENESDLAMALKLTALIAGANEISRAGKKAMGTMGVPLSVLYPLHSMPKTTV